MNCPLGDSGDARGECLILGRLFPNLLIPFSFSPTHPVAFGGLIEQ